MTTLESIALRRPDPAPRSLPRRPDPPSLRPEPAPQARLSDFMRDCPSFPAGFVPTNADLDAAAQSLDLRDLLHDAYESLTELDPGSQQRRVAQTAIANEIATAVERMSEMALRRAEQA